MAKADDQVKILEDAETGKRIDFSKDENEDRGNWSGKLDFLLSCLGYAVGLGNVWRFPYLCYQHGGGAFLIPYVIMLVFVGLPVFFLELSMGQFSSSGPLTVFRMSPLFQGIGIGMVIVSAFVGIYYNMIIAWSIYYLVSSFTSLLPWGSCDKPWNGDYCYTKLPDMVCNGEGFSRGVNGTCFNSSLPTQMLGLWNETLAKDTLGIRRKLPSEEYYENYVLGLTSGIHDLGKVKWQLVLCLILAWIIVFSCLSRGIKSSGKVVYFTALFPYAVLIILLIRGVTLEGHLEGIKFYIIPDFNRLLNAKVWNDAASQIFFSLSACFGGLITLSSYNRFHTNLLRDSLVVTFGNCLTSFFAGFVIFSFLGFQAHSMNTTVDKVVNSGPGLAFIVYPDAVNKMPISPLWAILFFIMLITLGLDSEFALCETVTTSLMDKFPNLRKRKTMVILLTCIFLFILGLPLCTEGGVYLLNLMDSYAGGWSVLFIGLLEMIAVTMVYGWHRISNDIRIMTGKRISIWWRVCWNGFSPILIFCVLVFSWVDYKPMKYGDYYTYPLWANVLGWLMAVTVIIFIPLVMIYHICTGKGSIAERFRNAAKPTVGWGPALVKHRRLVDYVDGFVVDPDNTESETKSVEQFAFGDKQQQQKYPFDDIPMQTTSMAVPPPIYPKQIPTTPPPLPKRSQEQDLPPRPPAHMMSDTQSEIPQAPPLPVAESGKISPPQTPSAARCSMDSSSYPLGVDNDSFVAD